FPAQQRVRLYRHPAILVALAGRRGAGPALHRAIALGLCLAGTEALAMDDAANHTPGRSGLILLAHGSRDALWRQPIEAVHQLVQAMRPDLHCICAYLDACAPDLPAAAQSLIAQGVEHLIVLPLFLGTGKHA